jgi:hypothetical protein
VANNESEDQAKLGGDVPPSAAVSFVTTEHFTLQGARSSTIAEATGRASMFLGAVSGGERGRVPVGGRRTAIDDPKSAASRRTVSVEGVQPGTVALLRALKARQAADRLALGRGYIESGLVLVDPLGSPVRPELYSDRFQGLCRQAGVRAIHLHLVRHTLANALNRAGVAIVDAAALLGHTPTVYVSTYLRKSEAGARSAADALGAALASRS